jgi:hypothetical protein
MADEPAEPTQLDTITPFGLTTPTLALPYPVATDPADVPADILRLDQRIEALAGAPNGFAMLDATGKVPTANLSIATNELAYAEITAPLSFTATTEASANVIVSAATITLDGTQKIRIDFFAAVIGTLPVTGQATSNLILFDNFNSTGAASIGILAVNNHGANANADAGPVSVTRMLTPAAGTHQYSIRGQKTNTPTPTVYAGPGGVGQYVPAFIAIRLR